LNYLKNGKYRGFRDFMKNFLLTQPISSTST
jgi:hypothetical protein